VDRGTGGCFAGDVMTSRWDWDGLQRIMDIVNDPMFGRGDVQYQGLTDAQRLDVLRMMCAHHESELATMMSNLQYILKREAAFVCAVDVPLDLVKEKDKVTNAITGTTSFVKMMVFLRDAPEWVRYVVFDHIGLVTMGGYESWTAWRDAIGDKGVELGLVTRKEGQP